MVNQYELNPEFWRDKVVVVLGGTGSMGKGMVNELLKLPVKTIRVAGQTELSKYKFITEFRDKEGYKEKVHPKIRNIRDYEGILRLTNGADIVLNAAAMKDVTSGIQDPDETYHTNIIGNMNVRNACIKNDVDVCLFVSTDKATNPTTFYGKTKFMAEGIYESGNNEKPQSCRTKFGSTRAGNLFGSRRSVIEQWDEWYKLDPIPEFKVTSLDMTRFFISIERVARYQLWCAERITGKEMSPFVPEILGCSLKEILEKRYPKAKYKVIGIFEGEKLYEEFPGNMRSDLKPWLVDYETLMQNL